MLLIVIPIAWLIIASGCLSICIMAARADAQPERPVDRAPLPTYELTPVRAAPELVLRDTRSAPPRVLTGRAAR